MKKSKASKCKLCKIILIAIFLIFLTASICFGCWFWFVALADYPPPTVDENLYFGAVPTTGEEEDPDHSIRPFKIDISDEILTDLQARLTIETSTGGNRLVPPLAGVGFQYGFNSNYLKILTKYWLEKYDWRIREKMLNKYPQFMTTIAGIEIHFQHVKSDNNAKYNVTRPLLLAHGWPGSFVEFQKIIPMLTDPKNSSINFELVIPSLPGFGFSERAHVPGLGPVEIAQIIHKLMLRLGYDKYYAHAGDWGSAIASNIASLYPENMKGLHINLCVSSGPKSIFKLLFASIYPSAFFTPEEVNSIYPLKKFFREVLFEETGYFHIQATKPDTLGAGLSNSPSGLLAYIVEKFSTATNPEWRNEANGGLEYWNNDELLDNAMVYWVTNSITSSIRFYKEIVTDKQLDYQMLRVPVLIPTACLHPPKELLLSPKWILQDKFQNLQRYNIAPKGGHFLALEVPDILAKDVLSFYGSLEKSHNMFK